MVAISSCASDQVQCFQSGTETSEGVTSSRIECCSNAEDCENFVGTEELNKG